MAEGLSETDIECFGSILMLTQQLMSRADEYLEAFGLTTRQWLLLAVLDKRFPGSAPSISEATVVFGTSRQNVKQVALQLDHRGWLPVEPDPVDRRMLRLVLTDKRSVFDDPTAQIYLAFGIVASDRVGLLCTAGAAAACIALALHRRSHRATAAFVMVVAAVPFAVATAWTVVMPLTELLMLAIGLPYELGHSHTVSSVGGTS